MRQLSRAAFLAVFLAVLAATAMPAQAANVAIASENTNATDFNNATTLEDYSVEGSGDSAYIKYKAGGSYDSTADLHYSFDQNEMPPVDEVNGYTATVGGSPTYVSGLVGSGALDFSGGDYLDNDRFAPGSTSTYSIHAVANPDAISSSGTIWFVEQGLFIRVQNGEMRYYHRDGGGAWNLVAQPTVSTGTTYKVGMSWDGSEVEAYLDGNQVGSMAISSIDSGTKSIWSIGNSPAEASPKPFDGVIDEPRLWQGHLTDSDFSTLASDPDQLLGSPAGDGIAKYVSQNHTVEQAQTGKVNLTEVTNSTVYVDWQYLSGGSWQSHTNTSYTTSGVKTADLSAATASKWRVKILTDDTDLNGASKAQADWITFSNSDPTVDNTTLSPEGTLDDNTPTFTVDVDDPDFGLAQGEELNASLYVNGQYKGSDTLTSAGTASVTATVTGDTQYYWLINDSYGGSAQSETVSIRTPEEVLIFNETAPYGLINQTKVTATITGSSGETVALYETTDGSIVLGGLPPEENYILTLQADGYFPKEIFVEDLYAQQEAYMLPQNVANVSNRITITDRTGQFGDDAILVVDRVIDTNLMAQTPDNGTEWVVVGGDRLGQSGFYSVELEQYGRYRFRVRSGDGAVRVLGEYTAKTDGVIDLQIGSVTYRFGDAEGWQWTTELRDVTGGNYSAEFAYKDTQDLTDSVTVEFMYRNNSKVFASKTFNSGPYGEIVYAVQVNNSTIENRTLKVEWSAQRDGGTINGSRFIGGGNGLGIPIDPLWKVVAFGASMLTLAFLVGSGAGAAPALVTVALVGGTAVMLGIAPVGLGFGAVVLVLVLGAALTVRNGARGV